MPAPIRVLVVDDSAFMRAALRRSIEVDPRFKVIDTAADGRQAVEKALRLQPDVVTLDVEMPVMNGIEALKVLVAKSTIPVIMVSAVTDSGAKITMDALELGAVDFIPKAKGAELIHEKLLAAMSANPARRGMTMRAQALQKAQEDAQADQEHHRCGLGCEHIRPAPGVGEQKGDSPRSFLAGDGGCSHAESHRGDRHRAVGAHVRVDGQAGHVGVLGDAQHGAVDFRQRGVEGQVDLPVGPH